MNCNERRKKNAILITRLIFNLRTWIEKNKSEKKRIKKKKIEKTEENYKNIFHPLQSRLAIYFFFSFFFRPVRFSSGLLHFCWLFFHSHTVKTCTTHMFWTALHSIKSNKTGGGKSRKFIHIWKHLSVYVLIHLSHHKILYHLLFVGFWCFRKWMKEKKKEKKKTSLSCKSFMTIWNETGFTREKKNKEEAKEKSVILVAICCCENVCALRITFNS